MVVPSPLIPDTNGGRDVHLSAEVTRQQLHQQRVTIATPRGVFVLAHHAHPSESNVRVTTNRRNVVQRWLDRHPVMTNISE